MGDLYSLGAGARLRNRHSVGVTIDSAFQSHCLTFKPLVIFRQFWVFLFVSLQSRLLTYLLLKYCLVFNTIGALKCMLSPQLNNHFLTLNHYCSHLDIARNPLLCALDKDISIMQNLAMFLHQSKLIFLALIMPYKRKLLRQQVSQNNLNTPNKQLITNHKHRFENKAKLVW